MSVSAQRLVIAISVFVVIASIVVTVTAGWAILHPSPPPNYITQCELQWDAARSAFDGTCSTQAR